MANSLDVIIVVHGIGRQREGETLSEVIFRLGSSGNHKSFAPLGELLTASQQNRPWFAPDASEVGFAEVHWARIADKHKDLTSSNIIYWSDRIAHQIAALDGQRSTIQDQLPTERLSRVVGDTVMTAQLARLILSRARLNTDGLVDSASHFISSYQLFADYDNVREEIITQFIDTLSDLEPFFLEQEATGTTVKVHILAHSLGSVIAFIALGRLNSDRSKQSHIRRINSLCTLGSPLDFFIILHPQLFDMQSLRAKEGEEQRIRWVNFVEHADPIASSCKVTNGLLERVKPTIFANDAAVDHEYGHARVPGGAHMAYWADTTILREYRNHCLNGNNPTRTFLQKIQRGFIRGHESAYIIGAITALCALFTAGLGLIWAENYGFLNFQPTFADIEPKFKLLRYGALEALIALCIFCQVALGSSMRAVKIPRLTLIFIIPFACSTLFLIYWSRRWLDTSNLTCWLAVVMVIVSGYQLWSDSRERRPQRINGLFAVLLIATACNILGLTQVHTSASIHPSLSVISVIHGELYLIAAAVLWWFTSLWWRLAIVWSFFVIGRRHLNILAGRWALAIARLARA